MARKKSIFLTKDEVISVRVDSPTKEAMIRLAHKNGKELSAYINALYEQAIKTQIKL